MEQKALLYGLALTLGVFAIKGGIGLSYYLAYTKSWKRRILVSFSYIAIYFFLIITSYYLTKGVNILSHLNLFTTLFKSGMFLHGLLAILLFIWGIRYLTQEKETSTSKGWLLLAFPCPLCTGVIFISTSLIVALYPENIFRIIGGIFLYFILVALLCLISFTFFQNHLSSPHKFLGWAMIVSSCYFIGSIIIAPQFSQIKNIYGLALNDNSSFLSFKYISVTSIIILFAFIIGYFSTSKLKR